MSPATSSCDSQWPHDSFFMMTKGQELHVFLVDWRTYSLYQFCEEFKIIPILQMRRLSSQKLNNCVGSHKFATGFQTLVCRILEVEV